MLLDFADIRPTILNWFTVGLMAVTFITFWKWFFSRYGADLPVVSGIADLFASI